MDKILKVKLYGEAFTVHKIEIDLVLLPMFIETAKLFNEPLHIAILNIDFFDRLGLDSFQSLDDVFKYTFSGLLNNNKSNIEIYYGRKRLAKFQLEELFRPRTLFSLFKTNVSHINANKMSKGIYFEEVEIGLTGTFEIEIENFSVDLLEFILVKLEISNSRHELLNAIYYENKRLKKVKSDTLLRSQFSYQKT